VQQVEQLAGEHLAAVGPQATKITPSEAAARIRERGA
jgi:hypothetical protein